MSASRAAKAFTLDESVTSDAEKFFESDIQQTRAAGLYENAIRPGVVEQFEVDDSQVGTTSKQSFFRFASDALSVKRYQGFFDINVDDISGRIFRSCVPYRGLFEPPPRPSVITAPQSHDLSDSDDSDEVVVASLAATRISGEDASASAVTSMEYAKPFNSNPDLYAPIWISTTLILSIAISANLSTLLWSVAARQDVFHGATLRAIDFSNLVQASSAVYSYVIIMTIAVVIGKRYIQDGSNGAPVVVTCIFGYSLAPLVPGSFLCAILPTIFSWVILIVATLISSCTVATNLWPDMINLSSASRSENVDEASESSAIDNIPLVSLGPWQSPTWWLRVGVVVTHVLFGMFLKFRFL